LNRLLLEPAGRKFPGRPVAIVEGVAHSLSADPNSVFKVVGVQPATNGEVVVRWTSVAGKSYSVEKADGLGSGFYELVRDLPGTPPLNTYRDANPPGTAQVFYRVRVR
jgi:hypothetical protein